MDPSNQCEECGKTFANSARLFVHQKKSCRDGKRSLTELLSDARNLWKAIEEGPRKRQKLQESTSSTERNARPRPQHRRSGDSPNPALPPLVLALVSIPTVDDSTLSREPANVPLTEEHLLPSDPIQGHSTGLSQISAQSLPQRDMFGLFKRFDGCLLSHSPDPPLLQDRGQELCTPSVRDVHAENTPNSHGSDSPPVPNALIPPQFYPYPNWSSFELGDLFWSHGTTNSLGRFKDLISLIRHPDFNVEDVRQADWNQINEQLADGRQHGLDDGIDWIDDVGPGWTTSRITIRVPFSNKGQGSKFGLFDAGVLHHRRIISVIKEQLAGAAQHTNRHFQAFQLLWQPDLSKEPIRVYNEAYSSEEFRRLEEEVRGLALGPEDDGLERVVIALMFWSDATLLASFGGAKLWPCYLFFGNDSKYLRAKPSADLCNHIAYFEALPDSFKDWYRAANGRSPTKDLVTHCRREIFHRQWDILLDDDLLRAMKSGIRINCPDNVTRLFFPRIFTYSADYPEKATIATIKYQGDAPCPRCLIRKCEIHGMGSPDDASARISSARIDNHTHQEKVRLAREMIFREGYTVDSEKLDDVLRAESLVPVENAFSKLEPFGLNIYSTLVVDLMHEFELGVWKATFIHLIRLLEADDRARKTSAVNKLDRRYRAIPLFGPDTIRKFSANVSEQKKLAARDYANLLQCAILAFDGLLPEPHNTIVHQLLFLLGEWHALAKLRMHTELTVTLLEAKTSELAGHLRTFVNVTCQAFETVETAKEYTTRLKRAAKKKENVNSDGPVSDQLDNPPVESASLGHANDHPALTHADSSASVPTEPSERPAQTSRLVGSGSNAATSTSPRKGRLRKTLNLQTYKYHALGDYANQIRQFGTTDSYSTERGEMEHKLPTSWFLRTNKKAYKAQLARIERRRANLRKIRQKARGKLPKVERTRDLKASSIRGRYCSYTIAKSQSSHQHLSDFLPVEGIRQDPALKDFLPTLRKHLCQRMEGILRHRHPHRFAEVVGDTGMDESFVVLTGERIYSHKTLHLRYTAYDCSEGSDLVWPTGSKGSIMMLNPAYPTTDVHPYVYGKVVGIFHANVVYVKGFQDLPPEHLNFLWVRWYTWQGKSGGAQGMEIINFPPVQHHNAFGFVDPGDVLRGCHVIPRFSAPTSRRFASFSKIVEDKDDHAAYFVNIFADRDMSMRYRWGFAVGHTYTHKVSSLDHTPSADQGSITGLIDARLDKPRSNGAQSTAAEYQAQDAACDEEEMIFERSDLEGSTSEEEEMSETEDESDEE